MKHVLMLEVSENIYELVVQQASQIQIGQPPESLAAQWIAAAATGHQQNDPLDAFIGAFNSAVPDWVDHHDKYLGQALLDQHNSADVEG